MRLLLIGLMASIALPANASEGNGLGPLQMVRSMQLVQDRIASGDHAALPMQRKLLEMVDERFRQAAPDELEKPGNFRALLVYGMSGGNPNTVRTALARLRLEGTDRQLAIAVNAYLAGNPGGAKTALHGLDPRELPDEIAAFAALIYGSVLAIDEPGRAMAMLDDARLLAPGTLVEEAALRRAVSLSLAQKDAKTFTSASSQYVRRFLRSPYANHFAETLVTGIAQLFAELNDEDVEDILSWMSNEQARDIYLRLARQSAIDGNDALHDFAARNGERNDPRNTLYTGVASVASETVTDVLDTLQTIDPKELSRNDKELLDAARAVAAEVVAPPVTGSIRTVEAEPDSGETELFISNTRERLEAIDRLLGEVKR